MYKFLKVVFDVLLALIALVCVSWLLLPCMLILWYTGEHKVWYLQKRVGYRNRMFSIFKFATMLKNSPNMGTGSLTTRNDPRVLPFGRFLRKTKINELPQYDPANVEALADIECTQWNDEYCRAASADEGGFRTFSGTCTTGDL